MFQKRGLAFCYLLLSRGIVPGKIVFDVPVALASSHDTLARFHNRVIFQLAKRKGIDGKDCFKPQTLKIRDSRLSDLLDILQDIRYPSAQLSSHDTLARFQNHAIFFGKERSVCFVLEYQKIGMQRISGILPCTLNLCHSGPVSQ